jgi:hypothetical protein
MTESKLADVIQLQDGEVKSRGDWKDEWHRRHGKRGVFMSYLTYVACCMDLGIKPMSNEKWTQLLRGEEPDGAA